MADPERVSSIVLRQNYTMNTAFSSNNNERSGAFASGAFASRSTDRPSAFGSGAFGPSAAKASAGSSYNAERSGAFASGAFSSKPRTMAYGGAGSGGGHAGGFGLGSRPPTKKEPVVVAASYTDFPSLKKATAPTVPSKPVMNFKAVAEAAASKPAPPPPSLATAKAKAEPGCPSYYQGEWADHEEDEEDLEITDEDGGLNSRRAGDKSNW